SIIRIKLPKVPFNGLSSYALRARRKLSYYLQYYFDCLFIFALKNNFIVYPNNKPEIVQITTPISIVFIFISLPSYKGKTIDIIININNPQPNPVLIQLFLS